MDLFLASTGLLFLLVAGLEGAGLVTAFAPVLAESAEAALLLTEAAALGGGFEAVLATVLATVFATVLAGAGAVDLTGARGFAAVLTGALLATVVFTGAAAF